MSEINQDAPETTAAVEVSEMSKISENAVHSISTMDFDWDSVGDQILSVYEMALAGNTKVSLASENRFWNRLRSND
jgi:hypothetical protein